MDYRSKLTLFGLPLVHVCYATNGHGYRRKTARGWIAIGDVAVGVLFAMGGIACGGVAIGGLVCGGIALGGVGLGLVSLAGLAIGGYALGGMALGFVAIGGGAIAWYAAYGGMAIAHDFSFGGLSIAQHANDEAAREFMNQWFMRLGRLFAENSKFLMPLGLLPLLLVLFNKKRRQPQTDS